MQTTMPADVLPYRIHTKIRVEDGHWLWTAYKTAEGYGIFQRQRAHRVVYELLVAPIPIGYELDHLKECGRTDCVNPEHLEAVTHRENCLRGRNGYMHKILQQEGIL